MMASSRQSQPEAEREAPTKQQPAPVQLPAQREVQNTFIETHYLGSVSSRQWNCWRGTTNLRKAGELTMAQLWARAAEIWPGEIVLNDHGLPTFPSFRVGTWAAYVQAVHRQVPIARALLTLYDYRNRRREERLQSRRFENKALHRLWMAVTLGDRRTLVLEGAASMQNLRGTISTPGTGDRRRIQRIHSPELWILIDEYNTTAVRAPTAPLLLPIVLSSLLRPLAHPPLRLPVRLTCCRYFTRIPRFAWRRW